MFIKNRSFVSIKNANLEAKRIRVLIFSELWYPHGSGAEVATCLYAKAWAAAGVEVTVLTNLVPGEQLQECLDGYKIIRVPLLQSNQRLRSFQIQLKSFSYKQTIEKQIALNDIIYVTGKWYWPIIPAKKQGKTVVCHLHDYEIECPLDGCLLNVPSSQVCSGCSPIKGARCINLSDLERGISFTQRTAHLIIALCNWKNYASFISEYVDCFIFVSKSQKRLFKQVAPSVWRKGRVVYNPVPETPETAIEELGFAYLGGGYKNKGYDTIISVLSKYKPPHPFYATKCTNTELARLKSLGVFAYPKVSTSDLNQILKKVHCIIFPSIWEEPLPYAFTNAMLSGKIVIASRIGSVMELAKDSPGVIQINPYCTDDFVRALKEISSLSKLQAKELGHQNQQVIKQLYGSLNPPAQLLSIFESLIAR